VKILFLTHTLPYPPVGGGAIKRWRMIQYLVAHQELTVASLYRSADLTWKDRLLSQIQPSQFYGELVADRPRNLPNLLKSYRQGVPLAVYRNRFSNFQEQVARIAPRFDLIFLDSVLVFQYVPAGFTGSVILHQHNAEYVIWERFAALEKNPFRKWAALLEARRMGQYEKLAAHRADRILAAPEDRSALESLRIAHVKFVETLHLENDNLLDLPNIDFDKTEESLLFVGALDWGPNTDGLVWFIRSVWELLKRRQPRLKFTIVGSHAQPDFVRLVAGKTDIVLTGFIEDLEPFYTGCRVFVAPVRYGSGMKVKLINAMYRGIPAVTTPLGAESLEVEDGCHLAVAATPEKMVGDILRLLNDKEAWERMRDHARRLAREKYRWDRVLANLEAALTAPQVKTRYRSGALGLRLVT
jgi:polysaccharide biosynthesis protein PslH